MQTLQDVLSRYPALNILAIALWTLYLLVRLFGVISQTRLWRRIIEYLTASPDSTSRRSRVTSISTLRPICPADASAIRRTGRVPLEYNLGQSRLKNIRVWRRLFLLGPSSPKPAFAISKLEITQERLLDSSTRELNSCEAFVPGGYRLKIWLCRGESPRHFIRTLRSGFGTDKRTLAVCLPEELGQRRSEASYYCAYAPSQQPDGDEYCCVTLYSSDPLFSGRAHHNVCSLDRAPLDIVWLVLVGSEYSNRSGYERAKELSDPDLSLRRFPKPIGRRAIYVITALAFATIAGRTLYLLYIASGSSANLLWIDWWAVIILVYFGIPLTLWNVFRHSLFEYREFRSKGAKSFWYGDVSIDQFGWRSRRRCTQRMWTASTTRCIADGFKVRNRMPL